MGLNSVTRKITFRGRPVTLVGRQLRLGAQAPGFRVVAPDLKEVTLRDFSTKIKLITTFPSIDTPLCDSQVREFEKRATGLSDDIVMLGVSFDLPFAQRRFCAASGVKRVVLVSDYKYVSFGLNYGLLVRELNLLARAVLILDKGDVLRYMEIVDELTAPPHYEEALKNLEEILKNPAASAQEALPVHCKPCEGGVLPLSKEKIEGFMAQCRSWQLAEDKKISKEFKFGDFSQAKYFLDAVSLVAAEEGHHPTLTLGYGRVKVTLTTHAASGLTENDFIMAKLIDELAAE